MRKSRALALVALVVMGALVPVWSPMLVSAAEETGTFSGEVSIEMNDATNGSTARYDLADARKAGNFSVELTGRESTETETVSGTALTDGETLPVEVAGTRDPTDAEVTFTGVERTRQTFWTGSASDGATDSISVGGNKAPANATVTFTGMESMSSNSWSATSQSDGESTSISVGGNVPPENQQVTFTGRTTKVSPTTEWTTGNPGSGSGIKIAANGSTVYYGDNNDEVHAIDKSDGSVKWTASTASDTIRAMVATENAVFVGTQKEVFAYSSDGTKKWEDSYRVNALTLNNGELWAADHNSNLLRIDKQTGDTLETVSLEYTDQWVDYLEVDPSGAFYAGYWYEQNVRRIDSTGSTVWTTNLSQNGEDIKGLDYDPATDTVITVDTASFGAGLVAANGADGTIQWSVKTGGDHEESVTVLDGKALIPYTGANTAWRGYALSNGSLEWESPHTTNGKQVTSTPSSGSILTIDGNGGIVHDTTIKHSENPGVDVDGDGSVDGQYSGTLADGETATVSLSGLSAGSNSVTTFVSGAAVDWTIQADEVSATKDPAVDVGNDGTLDANYLGALRSGETATVSLSRFDNETNELAFATGGEGFDWEIKADERIVTEDPELDVDGDGVADASVSGMIQPGESVTRSLNLSRGSYQPEAGVQSWSGVDVGVDYIEVSESENPKVFINGYEANYQGTLAKNETTMLNVSTDWPANGTNTVEVRVGESLSTSAPTARVGVDYYHTAATSHSTSYNSTAWTEERTINKTFIDDQQDAMLQLPFHDSVVSLKTLGVARNGSEYTRMDSANYEYDTESAVVTVDLGDVEANESVSVHAKGWRVKVNDGDIAIRDPTLPGDRLDTAIEVTEKGEDFWLGIQNQRIVHTYDESWDQPSERSLVEADSAQRLQLPNAATGATTRVEYTPLEVEPQRGDAVVSIEDLDAQQFHIDRGRTNGDPVKLRWLNAVEDKQYALWSVTHSDTRTIETAGANGVVFTDDDSAETLQVIESKDADESGIGGPFGLGQSLQGGLVLALVAGSVALVFWLQRRYGSRGYGRRDVLVLLTTAGAVTLLGMEIVAPGSASGLISSGTIPILGGAVLAILGLYYGIDYLPGGRRLKVGYLGVGVAFVGVLALEVLAPGSISGTLGPTIAEALDPAIRLGGLAGVGLATYALYRWLFGNSSSSSGNSSSSGGSTSEDDSAMTQVIVQDNDDSVTTSSGGDD